MMMKDSGPGKQKPHRRVATTGWGGLRGPASSVPQAQERKQQAKRGGAGEERRPAGTLGTQRRKLRELAQACWTPRRKYLSQNRS